MIKLGDGRTGITVLGGGGSGESVVVLPPPDGEWDPQPGTYAAATTHYVHFENRVRANDGVQVPYSSSVFDEAGLYEAPRGDLYTKGFATVYTLRSPPLLEPGVEVLTHRTGGNEYLIKRADNGTNNHYFIRLAIGSELTLSLLLPDSDFRLVEQGKRFSNVDGDVFAYHSSIDGVVSFSLLESDASLGDYAGVDVYFNPDYCVEISTTNSWGFGDSQEESSDLPVNDWMVEAGWRNFGNGVPKPFFSISMWEPETAVQTEDPVTVDEQDPDPLPDAGIPEGALGLQPDEQPVPEPELYNWGQHISSIDQYRPGIAPVGNPHLLTSLGGGRAALNSNSWQGLHVYLPDVPVTEAVVKASNGLGTIDIGGVKPPVINGHVETFDPPLIVNRVSAATGTGQRNNIAIELWGPMPLVVDGEPLLIDGVPLWAQN